MKLLFWTSLVAILYTYFGYIIILYFLSRFIRRTRRPDAGFQPSVTIVISAYNEEKVIENKVKNCLSLDYPSAKLELLIGSDGSSDKTNAILQNLESDRVHPFLFSERRGKAPVLNDLVRHASGEILLFTDANTVFGKDAVRKIVGHFADSNIGGVCGRLKLETPNENIGGKGESLYWRYENVIKRLESRIRTVLGANGGIYAIRRELYEPLPADEVVVDDFLISLNVVKMNLDVVFEEEAEGHEYTSHSFEGEFRRKIRISAANFSTIKYILTLLNPFRLFPAFGIWSHKIIRWFVPFFYILLFTSTLFLAASTFYAYLLGLQLLFLCCVCIGWILMIRSCRTNIFSYSYYFVMMNIALFVGFIKFVFGSQKPAWSRTER